MNKAHHGSSDRLEARKPYKIICNFENSPKAIKKSKKSGSSDHNCQSMTIEGKQKPAFAIINTLWNKK